MTALTSTQAFWLGHLLHASSRQLALNEYAEEQALDLASLLAWEQRLVVQGVPVPPSLGLPPEALQFADIYADRLKNQSREVSEPLYYNPVK